MKRTLIIAALTGVALVTLRSCASIPEGAVAIKPFDKDKYLGQWYEIARMDFRFERNLNNVTATYSLKDNGSIKVDNRGFDYLTKKWKQAIGKAKFAGSPDEARLKVSFFGPFYSGYNVIALDNQYKYALIAGQNLKYLWILSRETIIPESTKQSYLEIAKGLGYDVSTLIWTEHDKK
jgi:apolipoprotein D and lipocalin family protein